MSSFETASGYTPHLQSGDSPLLISVPHAGTGVPPDMLEQLTADARPLPDTDWYVDRLYAWALEVGAGMLVAPLSRYVIDLNRPPDDAPLYDSPAATLLTGLVPTTTFSGAPVYAAGKEPDEPETIRRLEIYWRPYHRILHEELIRIRKCHGHAVLLDAHSIRSQLPLLFHGTLPDLNLGSNGRRSAAASLLAAARSALGDSPFSMVVDGRFKGGYITRHYGVPHESVHALQLEMAQSAYMQEDPPRWRDASAQPMQVILRRLVHSLMQWKPGNDGT